MTVLNAIDTKRITLNVNICVKEKPERQQVIITFTKIKVHSFDEFSIACYEFNWMHSNDSHLYFYE